MRSCSLLLPPTHQRDGWSTRIKSDRCRPTSILSQGVRDNALDKSKTLLFDKTLVLIFSSLSLIEQKIVLSMFVRRFNPQEVMKKSLNIQEGITIVLDDEVGVRLGLVTD
jgi:hypothetical protein